MKTIKETLHIYWQEDLFDKERGGKFLLFGSKDMAQYGYIYVSPAVVEVPVPANFDPRAAKLASLQEEERKTRADFTRRITEIQRQIGELLALEMA